MNYHDILLKSQEYLALARNYELQGLFTSAQIARRIAEDHLKMLDQTSPLETKSEYRIYKIKSYSGKPWAVYLGNQRLGTYATAEACKKAYPLARRHKEIIK